MWFVVRQCVYLVLISLLVSACAPPLPKTLSELQQGRRYFAKGYYKDAMRYLLPAAIECDREAQYAVGYMYYYGYGVSQDTAVGYIWIARSAKQGYDLAARAITLIHNQPQRLAT